MNFSDGRTWETFEAKDKIPLHLLSFAVTNFKNESVFTNDLEFSVWTSVDKPENSAYVLNIGRSLIRCIVGYFKLHIGVDQINIFGLPQRIPRQRAKVGMIYVS